MHTIDNDESNAMRLRAHHICCIPFWDTSFQERGEDFLTAEDKIKNTMNSGSDVTVTVAEGADDLCRYCPLCVEGRCDSPLGDEVEVRKWDFLLLRDLGLSYGASMTSAEWRKLIADKVPFKLCRKCQWKHVCRVGSTLL